MGMDLYSLRRRIESWNGTSIRHDLTDLNRLLERINELEADLEALADADLRDRSAALRSRALSGESETSLVCEAFALVREASRRALGMRPFDVQVLAALAMREGRLVEMATGEGKTLAAVLPAYLAGLTGRGVHVLTFNDYLARRDAEWMGPLYRFLGSSVGWVGEGMSRGDRRRAYRREVTYVTAKEAGFDLLRDQLVFERAELVHRRFAFAIVDEADSILIDEARVPLVIAGSVEGAGASAVGLAELARGLEPDRDYETDPYGRNVELTEAGIDQIEELLGCGNLVAETNLPLLTRINCALHAHVLLRRDVDYIVRDGRIKHVDEFTGRVVEDRHWPDGLQAALEAKERLERRPEGRVLGSITLQHFVRLYPRLAGMTATARPAAEELRSCYGLGVVVIPPNRPSVRIDQPDHVFTHRAAKHAALVEEMTRVHATGRPILVGTASVRESEELSGLLREAGVEHEVLNARNDEREAAVVAEAGAPSAVTISTNMAGRGTDIRLGGADERDRERVVVLGGLYVIGTNRHESLRIDRQLRGRAGRQGDPGSSRFFVSLEDPLIVRYGVGELIPARLYPERQDGPLDDPFIRHEIARAQRIIEGQNADIRKALYAYSAVVEEQRREVAELRRDLLDGAGPARVAGASARRSKGWPAAPASSDPSHTGLRHDPHGDQLGTVHFHLACLDREWARHLERLADLREGIHLVRIGGEDPVVEFSRAAADSFAEMKAAVEKAARSGYEELGPADLRGPASTWTYLVHDEPFREQLATALGGNVGVGAAAAALAGPFWIASALYQHLRKKRRRTR